MSFTSMAARRWCRCWLRLFKNAEKRHQSPAKWRKVELFYSTKVVPWIMQTIFALSHWTKRSSESLISYYLYDWIDIIWIANWLDLFKLARWSLSLVIHKTLFSNLLYRDDCKRRRKYLWPSLTLKRHLTKWRGKGCGSCCKRQVWMLESSNYFKICIKEEAVNSWLMGGRREKWE